MSFWHQHVILYGTLLIILQDKTRRNNDIICHVSTWLFSSYYHFLQSDFVSFVSILKNKLCKPHGHCNLEELFKLTTLNIHSHWPAVTRRNNNVIMTSKQHRNIVEMIHFSTVMAAVDYYLGIHNLVTWANAEQNCERFIYGHFIPFSHLFVALIISVFQQSQVLLGSRIIATKRNIIFLLKDLLTSEDIAWNYNKTLVKTTHPFQPSAPFPSVRPHCWCVVAATWRHAVCKVTFDLGCLDLWPLSSFSATTSWQP